MKKITMSQILFIALFVFFVSCNGKADKSTPESLGFSSDSLKLAETKIQEFVDEGKVAGFSTLVLKDGKVAQRGNFGFADIESQMPYDDNTIVRIFSMSKPITAVALMTLFDEGKFQLDDKVSKYIPEYAGIKVYTPNENGFTLEEQENEMTIRHLLTHTSGISYGWDRDSYVDSLYRAANGSTRDGTIKEKMLALAELPLNFQPGTEWKYGLSIDVVGYLVEVLSGISFDEYLKANVLEPLKMEDAGFFVPEEKHGRLATLYNNGRDGKLVAAPEAFGDRIKKKPISFSGGGGMVASMNDYARFCKMLLNGGELDGTRILSTKATNLILTNQLPETALYENGEMGYGLGGAVDLKSGEYSWAGMASTNFWINPETKTIIITYTQLLPSNYSYGNAFKKMIENAMID